MFYNSYDLTDLEIKFIKSHDNYVDILICMDSHLDLMGNGIRPSLDVSYNHLFVFEYSGDNIHLDKNIVVDLYEYKDDKIRLKISGKEIYLLKNTKVVLNYV